MLFTFFVIGLALSPTQSVLILISIFVLVPTNYLNLWDSEILRQFNFVNTLALSFLLKLSLGYKKTKDFGSKRMIHLGIFFVLATITVINLLWTTNHPWTLAMFPRTIFLIFTLTASTQILAQIDYKKVVNHISHLITFLLPFALIEIASGGKIFFVGRFGLPSMTVENGINPFLRERLWSTLGHPNAGALFFSLASLILANEVIKDLKSRRYLIQFLFSITMLFFTGSRSGLIGLVAGLIWLIFWRISISGKLQVAIISIFSFPFLSGSIGSAISSLANLGFGRQQDDALGSWQVRLIVLDNRQIFANLPFFGVGQGNSSKLYAEAGNGYILENSFYQVLISFGITLGFLFLFTLLVAVITVVKAPQICFLFPAISLFISSNAWEGFRAFQVVLAISIILARLAAEKVDDIPK